MIESALAIKGSRSELLSLISAKNPTADYDMRAIYNAISKLKGDSTECLRKFIDEFREVAGNSIEIMTSRDSQGQVLCVGIIFQTKTQKQNLNLFPELLQTDWTSGTNLNGFHLSELLVLDGFGYGNRIFIWLFNNFLGRSAATILALNEDKCSMQQFFKFVKQNCPEAFSKVRILLIDKD